jgi:mercuric ion transport protein
MTDTVELIYDHTCPHVGVARDRLRAALVDAELPAVWQEWERSARGVPRYVRQWASPTILVNGRDVAALDVQPPALDGGAGCRVYQDAAGRLEGAPAVSMIVAALAARRPPRSDA